MKTLKITFFALLVLLLADVSLLSAQYVRNYYITWIGVIDNGEGDDWPHGPLGNLHLQLYDCNGREISHTIIEGPSNDEWLDGDQGNYCIYIGNPNCVYYVKIWESDGGSIYPGRADDMLYEGCPNSPGLWYSGYRANNDACINAIRRGANSWVKEVWDSGITSGVPAVFIKVSYSCY